MVGDNSQAIIPTTVREQEKHTRQHDKIHSLIPFSDFTAVPDVEGVSNQIEGNPSNEH